VSIPQLHVCAVRGVTDVQRIKYQKSRIVPIDYVLGQAFPAVLAHGLQIGQIQAGSLPFPKRKLGGADFYAVGIIRGVIA